MKRRGVTCSKGPQADLNPGCWIFFTCWMSGFLVEQLTACLDYSMFLCKKTPLCYYLSPRHDSFDRCSYYNTKSNINGRYVHTLRSDLLQIWLHVSSDRPSLLHPLEVADVFLPAAWRMLSGGVSGLDQMLGPTDSDVLKMPIKPAFVR